MTLPKEMQVAIRLMGRCIDCDYWTFLSGSGFCTRYEKEVKDEDQCEDFVMTPVPTLSEDKRIALRLMGIEIKCENCRYWDPYTSREALGGCLLIEDRHFTTTADSTCQYFSLKGSG